MAVVAGAAALTIAALGTSAGAAMAAPTFRCEASALRGTVAGTSIEPSVAGRGSPECQSSQSGLTVPLPAPLTARSAIATTVFDAVNGSALATGGLLDLGIGASPDALAPVLAQLDAAIAAKSLLTVPLPAGVPSPPLSLDIGPQLRALAPRAPADALLTAQVVNATARASCRNGLPSLGGDSQVAGVRLMGTELPVDAAVSQVVKVFGGGAIDPSQVDAAALVPAGLQAFASQVTPAIQSALDALPSIPVPEALANVRIVPGDQVRDGDTLTQRALRVSASIAGTPLVDLVLGEARVGVSGACPGAGVADEALRCTDRKLVLVDVLERRGRVRLIGAANRDYVGRSVAIRLRSSGRVVAHAKVRRDGSFATTAALPPNAVRWTNRARYRAEIRREKSLDLKLHRRMVVERMTARGGRVTIAGRVIRPLASPVRRITLKRRVSCRRLVVVKRFLPRRDGSFRVTVAAPKGQDAAVYRLQTRVRKFYRNPKTYPTFTLPRGVNLDKR